MSPNDPSSRSAATDTVTIVCLHCGKAQDVGRRAQTVTCKHCYKRLELQDLVFSRYEARRAIETTGVVTVERKGQVVVDRIHCGGLIVRGRVKGEVTSRGPVLVGPEADLIGDVVAPTLAVGAGAVLEGWYRVGQTKSATPPDVDPAAATPAEKPVLPDRMAAGGGSAEAFVAPSELVSSTDPIDPEA